MYVVVFNELCDVDVEIVFLKFFVLLCEIDGVVVVRIDEDCCYFL